MGLFCFSGEKFMDQKEFDKRKAAQINALECLAVLYEKPAVKVVKVIDLVEMLLRQNPSLPVVMQVGTQQFAIVSVVADSQNVVRLYV